MTLDDHFAHRYEATLRPRIDTPDGLIYIPARPGLTVEISPAKDDVWTGVFGDGLGEDLVTGLFTTPDENSVCVVSTGEGYFVQADDPGAWLRVDCIPVRVILPFPQHRLLVFGNFTELVAYGFDPESIDVRLKVAWRTDRLGWDGLEVVRVTDERIEGQAWHAPAERMVGFSVDVNTGRHEGGAYEELEPSDSPD
jgi:hypothetical protein